MKNGDVMENIASSQSVDILAKDSLFLTSSIFMDINYTIRNVHSLVAFIFQLVNTGMFVANNILGLIDSSTANIQGERENQ